MGSSPETRIILVKNASCLLFILFGSLLVHQSGNSFIRSSVDLMGMAAVGAAVGLTIVAVGAGAGFGCFVPGWMTVMAQFIFTTANLLHVGSPRMAGPGVSVTYQ